MYEVRKSKRNGHKLLRGWTEEERGRTVVTGPLEFESSTAWNKSEKQLNQKEPRLLITKTWAWLPPSTHTGMRQQRRDTGVCAACRVAFRHTHTRSINILQITSIHTQGSSWKTSAAKDKTDVRAHARMHVLLLPLPLRVSLSLCRLCDPPFALLTADETFGVTCLFRFDFPPPQHLSSCLSIHASQTHHSRAQIRKSHRPDDSNVFVQTPSSLLKQDVVLLFFC